MVFSAGQVSVYAPETDSEPALNRMLRGEPTSTGSARRPPAH